MDVTLAAETGRALGSRSSRRLLRDGKVPAVVYGLDRDTLSVAVEWPDLRAALTTEAGLNALITLAVDGDEDLTIVKDLQRDPVRRDVVHVDFLRVSRDVEIEVEVPIVLEGHAEKVEREDGTISHLLFSLAVYAKPGSIPNELTVDVTEMELHDSIRVADLSLPSGVRTEVDEDEVVVSAQISRETIEVAEEEELIEALDELAEAAAEGGDEGGGDDSGDDDSSEDSPVRRRGARGERRGTPADLLVVGLANPGRDYEGTRHNVGAEAVGILAERHGARLKGLRGVPATIDEVVVDGHRLALAVPTTYMNESGLAVRALVRRFGIEDDLARLVVIHDELDLPPGRVKVKVGGGLAGNNGLKSIRDQLHSTDFLRIRIGVGKPPSKERGAGHVLSRPGKRESLELEIAVREAADAAEVILTDGVERAMEQVNQRP